MLLLLTRYMFAKSRIRAELNRHAVNVQVFGYIDFGFLCSKGKNSQRYHYLLLFEALGKIMTKGAPEQDLAGLMKMSHALWNGGFMHLKKVPTKVSVIYHTYTFCKCLITMSFQFPICSWSSLCKIQVNSMKIGLHRRRFQNTAKPIYSIDISRRHYRPVTSSLPEFCRAHLF